MSRGKRIVKAEDGTPIEVEGEVNPAAEYPTDEGRDVVWTQKAQDEGVFSEHGQHKAGDIVRTTYAALFIERGHATEVSE